MTALGLIPARGGSKRLPGKNMRLLCGKPLVGHAIDVARAVPEIIERIVVSTDDMVTIEYAENAGAGWVVRPADIAQGITPPIRNVEHAVRATGYKGDAVIYLQPTSPLRAADDIRGAWQLFLDTGADAVVSVTEATEKWVYELGHAGRLRMVGSSTSAANMVSPNGAIYIISMAALERGDDWWSGVTYAYVMPKGRSIDIDFLADFEAVEAIMRNGNVA